MAVPKHKTILDLLTDIEPEENNKNDTPIQKTDDTSVSIQKTDDTSHISEIIKEKLMGLLEPEKAEKSKKETQKEVNNTQKIENVQEIINIPTEVETQEIITEKIAPKDTFISFEEIEENNFHFSNKIELNEIEFNEVELLEEETGEKQNITEEDFEKVLRNDSKEISLDSNGYIYINIMETFVKEVIVDYMKEYGACTCNHCIIDTMALTLTNLPSKYIVAKKGSLSPLLHMYRKKYEAQISTELLKACFIVSSSPHHQKK